MEILRSCWEIPSICHFCSVFKAAFHLFDFDIQELEEGLLANGDQESSSLVSSLIKRLLQGCIDEDVTLDNWEICLWEIFQERWVEESGRDHPFPSRSCSFNALPLHTKVEVLHTLCTYRLDSEDMSDVLKGIDSSKLRIDPIGKDSQGNIYWYFSGLRLYKEERRNSKWKKGDEGKLSWSLVCTTENDWRNLAKALGKSRGTADKALHKTITTEFLPQLQEIVSDQERLARKRLLESVPRRCSSRIEFKQKQKAREEELAALIAAEEERKRKDYEEKQRIEEEKERKAREIRERAKRAEERLKAIEDRANRARIRERKGQLQDESKTSSDNSEEEENSSVNSEQEMYPKKRSSITLQNSFSHILMTNGSSKRQKAESYGYSSGEESTDDSIPNGSCTGNYVTPTWSYSSERKNDSQKRPSSPITRSSSGIFVSQFYSNVFMKNQPSKHEIRNGVNMGMLADIVNQHDENSVFSSALPGDAKWNRKPSDVKVS